MTDIPFNLEPKYRVDRRLGSTATEEIFLAHQDGLEGVSRRVLVKTLPASLARDPERVLTFLDEARVAAQLAHPNIVHLYDFGESAGTYYTVVECYQGETVGTLLRHALTAGRKLMPGFVAAVGSQVCAGLAFAHHRHDEQGQLAGFVNGALDPDSIVACDDGQVKLLRFGSKRSLKAPRALPPGLECPASYRSPEQASGSQLDARSDVFSLGIILWELVAARRLVGGNTPSEQDRWVRQVVAPPLRSLATGFPEELAAIIERSLLIALDRRYPGASEMGRDLEAFLARAGSHANDEVTAELMRKEVVDTGASLQDVPSEVPGWMIGNATAAGPSILLPLDAAEALELDGGREPSSPSVEMKRVSTPPALAAYAARRAATSLLGAPLDGVGGGRRGPRLLAWIGVALALLALSGGGTYFYLTSHQALEPPLEAGSLPIEFRIDSDPEGATVRIDENILGKTPLGGVNVVPPGEHSLHLELVGFDPDARTVRGGEPLSLNLVLHPVLVHSLPPTPGAPPKPPPPKTVLWPLAGPRLPHVKAK